MGSSKILGILALCIGWLIPLAGITLSIIGLAIKKEKGKESRDKTLNILGLIISIFMWIAYMAWLL